MMNAALPYRSLVWFWLLKLTLQERRSKKTPVDLNFEMLWILLEKLLNLVPSRVTSLANHAFQRFSDSFTYFIVSYHSSLKYSPESIKTFELKWSLVSLILSCRYECTQRSKNWGIRLGSHQCCTFRRTCIVFWSLAWSSSDLVKKSQISLGPCNLTNLSRYLKRLFFPTNDLRIIKIPEICFYKI